MRKIIEVISEDIEEIGKKVLEETRDTTATYVVCNSNMANILHEKSEYVFDSPYKAVIGKVGIIGRIADINIFHDPDIKGDNNVFIVETI